MRRKGNSYVEDDLYVSKPLFFSREACPPRRPGRRPQLHDEFVIPPCRKREGFRKGSSQLNAKTLKRNWASEGFELAFPRSPLSSP